MLPVMSTSHARDLQIRPVEPAEQMESLKLLFSSLTPTQQLAEARRLIQCARDGKITLEGLLRGEQDGRLAGVIWAQIQAGRTAVVWVPRIAPGQGQRTVEALIAAATAYLENEGICIAQVLHAERESPESSEFEACGFEYLAELEYMASVVTSCEEPSIAPFELETYSTTNRERFIATLEQTYDNTLDCPALNGVRQTCDVLEGYQATGSYSPENWFLLRYEGRDAGCLLLSDHPETDQYELVYMGLVPEARGNRLGQSITQFARWRTHQAGRKRLVLAVDAKNEPARAMYEATGFARWDRRHVWVRRFPAKSK